MKKIIASACLIFTCLQSCVYVDSQDDIAPRGTSTETFDLDNFDELEMGSAFYVDVAYGPAFSVKATGELNDLDDLEVFVRDGKLIARYRNAYRNRRRMDLEIVMPDVAEVNFTGAVNAKIRNFENLPSLNMEISGATKCEFDGTARELDFDLSGASKLDLFGNAKFLDGELSGASRLNAFDMPVEESELELSGASSARVFASKRLVVDASGASEVRYKGNPVIDKKLSGASTLRAE